MHEKPQCDTITIPKEVSPYIFRMSYHHLRCLKHPLLQTLCI